MSMNIRPVGTAPSSTAVRIADSGGVLGAIFAALCCAGTPFIIAGLATVGLGFLKNDTILWPLMFASLAVALVAGVVFIHGFPAIQVIWTGVVALIGATSWNVTARRRCAAPSR